MSEALFSVIGNRYAEQLGYQHLIGSYAVVVEEMKALARVMIISAKDASLIGQEIDVHKQDLDIERTFTDNRYYVLVDIKFDEVIYSSNKELITYFIKHNVGKFFLNYSYVNDLSGIIDILDVEYPHTFFKIFNLDEPQEGNKYTDMVGRFHQLQQVRKDGDAAMKKLDELKANLALQGLIFGSKPKEPKASDALTEALRRQLEKQMNEMETIEPLGWHTAESHGLDKDEDDHDKPGGWGKFWNF